MSNDEKKWVYGIPMVRAEYPILPERTFSKPDKAMTIRVDSSLTMDEIIRRIKETIKGSMSDDGRD